MKQINFKRIKKIKNKKNSYKFFIFILLILTFILGHFSSQKTLEIKTTLGDFLDEIGKSLYTNFFISKKMKIDLNFEEYNSILKSRKIALDLGIMLNENNPWTDGQIYLDKQKFSIDIKIRGSHPSNWRDKDKMGYKIRLKQDQRYNGIKEFSIQHPSQREYIGEYLFMKILQYEGLIYSRSNFYNLIINGDNHGLYFFQESLSKEMIENNKKRETVIIGFNKEAHLEKYSKNFASNENYKDIQITDGFLISQIDLSNSGRNYSENKKKIFTKTFMMLNDFRNNKLKASDVFDIDKLAKLMAIKVIFGAGEFDWRDIKFYYNPFNLKLEPIGKEVGAGLLSENGWWSSNTSEINYDINDESQKIFLSLIFKDEIFYKTYLKMLNYFVQNEKIILNKLLKDEEISENLKKIKINYPRRHKSFSIEKISTNIKIIREYLNAKNYVSFNLEDKKKDSYVFSARNSFRLPIEIIGMNFNGEDIFFKERIIIPPRLAGKETIIKYFDIKSINLTNKIQNFNYSKVSFDEKNEFRSDISFLYRFKYLDEIYKSNILKFKTYDKNFYHEKKNILKPLNITSRLFKIESNNIIFNKGDLIIDKDLIIPKNFKVSIKSGTNIYFKNNASLISYSPINIIGSKLRPVKIESLERDSDQNFILIANTNGISKLNYVKIKNLSAPKDTSKLILGAVNFFNSDVIIKNSIFNSNSFGDDNLNIISSKFEIDNTTFNNSLFDAVDIDFSEGKIINTTVNSAGNDGIDFSYSNSILKNVVINNTGDKAVSVGEKSKIKIESIDVKRSKFAFASKDNSNLIVQNAQVEDVIYIGAAYQKKPEFGPSFLNIQNLNFFNANPKFAREKNSEIFLNGSLVEENKSLNFETF